MSASRNSSVRRALDWNDAMSCFLGGKTLREVAHFSISFSCIHGQPHPAMVSWIYAIMMHLSDTLSDYENIFPHQNMWNMQKNSTMKQHPNPSDPTPKITTADLVFFSSSIFSKYVFFYIIGLILYIIHFYLLCLVFSSILWLFSGIFFKSLQKYCSNWW